MTSALASAGADVVSGVSQSVARNIVRHADDNVALLSRNQRHCPSRRRQRGVALAERATLSVSKTTTSRSRSEPHRSSREGHRRERY